LRTMRFDLFDIPNVPKIEDRNGSSIRETTLLTQPTDQLPATVGPIGKSCIHRSIRWNEYRNASKRQ